MLFGHSFSEDMFNVFFKRKSHGHCVFCSEQVTAQPLALLTVPHTHLLEADSCFLQALLTCQLLRECAVGWMFVSLQKSHVETLTPNLSFFYFLIALMVSIIISYLLSLLHRGFLLVILLTVTFWLKLLKVKWTASVKSIWQRTTEGCWCSWSLVDVL